MSKRCKPGDLAVVVKCVYTPELVGRFVVVERAAKPIEEIGGRLTAIKNHENFWIVRSAADGQLLPVRYMERGVISLIDVPERGVRDDFLRPIRGEENTDEILTDQPIDEEVPA